MPIVYLLLHLTLSLCCARLVFRLPPRSHLLPVFTIGIFLLTLIGFLLERFPEIGWWVMRHTTPDLPYVSNLALALGSLLSALVWRAASDRVARMRACVLATLLLIVACGSYAWFFQPLPPGLSGQADAIGYCRQTTEDSCSAAAAVMLLNARGVHVSEAEMARLCLTRQGKGTPALGLYRGMLLKAGSEGLRLRLRRCSLRQLGANGTPGILSVGLSSQAPPEWVGEMSEYGWEPGHYHSVVVLGADRDGKWFDIADPSYGREKWPAEHLAKLWNGVVLTFQ